MADWFGSARSNYFRVKDEKKFREWASSCGLTVASSKDPYRMVLNDAKPEDEPLFAVYPDDSSDFGGWPSQRFVEGPPVPDDDTGVMEQEDGDFVDLDITEELAQHLPEGEVAILMEIGNEKLRYLTGWATAVRVKDGKPEFLPINLNDIYSRVTADWGVVPTKAEY